MQLKAVIFDLNGTVLSDEDEYGVAFRKVMVSMGKKVDEKYPHVGGIGVEENWPRLLKKYHIKTKKTVAELSRETQVAYLEQLSKVTLKPGFSHFAEDLKKSGIKLALATSNSWWVVEKIFAKLSVEHFFDCVTTADEVSNKKPSPEIFLSASEKLMIDPEFCLVIEDAESGVKAAKRAKMKVVGLARDGKHAKRLKKADMVAGSYEQITPDVIKKL